MSQVFHHTEIGGVTTILPDDLSTCTPEIAENFILWCDLRGTALQGPRHLLPQAIRYFWIYPNQVNEPITM